MNDETDRIPVPSNGRGPDPNIADAGEPVPREQTVALTPTQLAAGFGILAGLLVLFVRSRRGRSSGRDSGGDTGRHE